MVGGRQVSRSFALAGWRCGIVLLAALAPHAHVQPAIGAESAQACAGLVPGPRHTVAHVIDGETLALDDGRELRLIGALAPRALDAGAEPGLWPMEVAARAELEALALGKTVEIAFGGERTDRYGRLQGHAFIDQGAERRWLQGHLLRQGLARAYALAGNRACAEALLAAEHAARTTARGLWGEAAYHVRTASKPQALERYRATFQVVEGRIARVGQRRGTIYLNFARGPRHGREHDGPDRERRRGFSASIRSADLALIAPHGRKPAGLEGRSVRVRGWIEDRNGPMIDLSAGGQLEIIEDEARTAAEPGLAPAPR